MWSWWAWREPWRPYPDEGRHVDDSGRLDRHRGIGDAELHLELLVGDSVDTLAVLVGDRALLRGEDDLDVHSHRSTLNGDCDVAHVHVHACGHRRPNHLQLCASPVSDVAGHDRLKGETGGDALCRRERRVRRTGRRRSRRPGRQHAHALLLQLIHVDDLLRVDCDRHAVGMGVSAVWIDGEREAPRVAVVDSIYGDARARLLGGHAKEPRPHVPACNAASHIVHMRWV